MRLASAMSIHMNFAFRVATKTKFILEARILITRIKEKKKQLNKMKVHFFIENMYEMFTSVLLFNQIADEVWTLVSVRNFLTQIWSLIP